MELVDAGLIADFVVESQEGLANIEQQMLAIEAGGANVDLELVNAVFRTMHTIKGTAGFLGLDRIGSLAHGLEEVLDDLRNRELTAGPELVTTVLEAADFMKSMIDRVEASNDADITAYIEQLHRCRRGTAQPIAAPVEKPAPTRESVDAQTQATRDFVIECHEALDQLDADILLLEQNAATDELLPRMFRTMHTMKGGAGFLGFTAVERIAHEAENTLSRLRNGQKLPMPEVISALLATADQLRIATRLLDLPGEASPAGFDASALVQRLAQLNIPSPSTPPSVGQDETPQLGEILVARGLTTPDRVQEALAAQARGDTRKLGEILVQQGAVKVDEVAATLKTQQDARASASSENNIRVDVGLLDKLMTRVGELVLARNQILQYTSRLEDPAFISTAQRLNLITTELQEGVMKTRMQPIGNVWAKFPRVVRDLASQLGKQVRIEMEGKDTELDKTIVEAIKDPLTHLIRNSVDHGIEAPHVRRAAGKPEEGCLLLRAYHEGGQVNIEITDDGAGLNLDRIRKKAVERGLLSADQALRLADRDAAQLIFAPGFSTAEQVTSVSGRGVGMDVVKTNIERISGTIDLQSNPGGGTTVKIKIPLTLAIIPALIVSCEGGRYAIPQVNLLELVRLEKAQSQNGIEYVHGAPVFRLRGKLLPLVDLAERLNLSRRGDASDDGSINIVVLRANDRQFGLVVDKINDTEEIVVKPLSRQLKGLGEYAGATIMGDGAVALILDVMGLALASGLTEAIRDQNAAALHAETAKSCDATETLLVVGLGEKRRFALPISMISRLEKVSLSAVEYADGREVIQYRGAILPLLRLENLFGSDGASAASGDEMMIVVYRDENSHCGLVVDRIIDIVDATLDFEHRRTDDNLLGTVVIQKRVTDVLNLPRLASAHR